MNQSAVELKDIIKVFPGVTALDSMHLVLKYGEIHGLVGENGAGKSTLIKILSGVYQPTSGSIRLDGKELKIRNPLNALKHRIACIYQELNIAQPLSVTDNMFAGSLKRKKGSPLLDYTYMNRRAREIMASLNQEIEVSARVQTLGVGQQQMIEIGKALLHDAKVLILDEPTASLSEGEINNLFQTVKRLKEKGVAILFVSHKLEEIFELCDVVTVMRDAKHIVTTPVSKVTKDDLITMMVGRKMENIYPKKTSKPGAAVFEVRNLRRTGVIRNISFSLRKGEILGFSGLVGAGRTELMRCLFGADPYDEGEIYIHGEKVNIRDTRQAIAKKIAFITEDRKQEGLVLKFPIYKNMSMVNLKSYQKFGIINEKKVRLQAEETVKQLEIKTNSIDKIAGELSGGNQQKVIIGKWLNTDTEIYIFDEPTRGIDVGAKLEIYNIMNQLAEEGKAIIMVSSELPEILGMCDRVVVMREGEIMAAIDRDSQHFNQEDIMRAAWGEELRA
ncbi:sugar ABC transporter ATP-binding protein [Ruminococcus sp. OA3]|uniref:sugar ABC transporter ATP-binding protein n=1 Tax=Ruminococcus sp. OA3 TaxID=2914164 RepID=UPI001F06736E|nr:sugar ABC transporter ATP-binding protein [Ruminococcus sp. OA3]